MKAEEEVATTGVEAAAGREHWTLSPEADSWLSCPHSLNNKPSLDGSVLSFFVFFCTGD